jgi:hypothetical protein
MNAASKNHRIVTELPSTKTVTRGRNR